MLVKVKKIIAIAAFLGWIGSCSAGIVIAEENPYGSLGIFLFFVCLLTWPHYDDDNPREEHQSGS